MQFDHFFLLPSWLFILWVCQFIPLVFESVALEFFSISLANAATGLSSLAALYRQTSDFLKMYSVSQSQLNLAVGRVYTIYTIHSQGLAFTLFSDAVMAEADANIIHSSNVKIYMYIFPRLFTKVKLNVTFDSTNSGTKA